MIYQVAIALLLSLALLNLALNMRSLKVPRRNATVPHPAPLVSIIVPARNEEANIGPCLASLIKQDYPNFEIIVLDDNSEDATAAVVRLLSEGNSRVHLIDGEPLPAGWAGKPHACLQAARQAGGEWLLFTDADTIHSPDMLRRTLALAVETRVALLSGFPRQLTEPLSQKIAIPMIYFIILSLAPLWWLHRSSRPVASVAIGQFLLFTREAYWGIGGHEAVKKRITEDLYLGAEIAKKGGRHLAVDLSDLVSCRMYSSFSAVWDGLTRAIYAVSSISLAGLAGLLILGYISFLAPFYWLWKMAFDSAFPPVWGPLVIFQVALLFIMRRWVDARFKESLLSTILFPLGITFIIAVAINGMARQLAGTGVSWKNRVYDKGSSV
ncbi:MAG: glycosyltransferase [Dehalococcoidia bacterium]|nr:MAG: glycosyltransferase [Dehalococcoidia bacterium]